MFTSEIVDELANKLLIDLTPEENKRVLDEFEIIDKTCSAVNEIPDIDKVKPMTHCLDMPISFLRDDVAKESVDIDVAMANCDDSVDGMVEVPKVVG